MNRFPSLMIVAALALAACGPTDPPLTKTDNNKTTPMDMGGMETTPDMSAPEGCETTEADETTCDGEDNDCDGVTDENCACDFEQKTNGVCPAGAIDASSGTCAARKRPPSASLGRPWVRRAPRRPSRAPARHRRRRRRRSRRA